MKKLLIALCALAMASFIAAPTALAAAKGKGAPAKKETVAASKASVKAPAKVAAKPAAKPAKAAAKKSTAKKPAKKSAKKVAKPLPKSDWSPNNFPAGNRGWCTWYVDGRFYKYFGEKIELSPRPGSNAHLWFPRAQKVVKNGTGEAGDVMVLKRPKGDRTGHVAFVEEVIPGVGWVVTQANFDFRGHKPLRVDYVDGRKITTDLFVPGPRPGTVRLEGGNSVYNLLGFLHKEDNSLLALAGGERGDKGGIGGDGWLPTEAVLDIAAASVAEKEEVVAVETAALLAAEYAANVERLESVTPVLDPDECGCSIKPRLTL